MFKLSRPQHPPSPWSLLKSMRQAALACAGHVATQSARNLTQGQGAWKLFFGLRRSFLLRSLTERLSCTHTMSHGMSWWQRQRTVWQLFPPTRQEGQHPPWYQLDLHGLSRCLVKLASTSTRTLLLPWALSRAGPNQQCASPCGSCRWSLRRTMAQAWGLTRPCQMQPNPPSWPQLLLDTLLLRFAPTLCSAIALCYLLRGVSLATWSNPNQPGRR